MGIDQLKVHMVNVDHGDCIVLIGYESNQPKFSMIVDGGSSGKVSASELSEKIEFPKDHATGKPRVDLLIASHHDKDHLGGLVSFLESNHFAIMRAWSPVLFNPPELPWLSVSDTRTFTEDAIENPDQACEIALKKIEAIAKEAMISAEERNSEDHWKRLEQSKAYFANLNISTKEKTREFNAESRISDIAAVIFGTAGSNDHKFLREIVSLGSNVPGVIGCGAFGDREVAREDLQDLSPLDMQVDLMELRKRFNGWENQQKSIRTGDTAFIAMMATRAAYNVALTTAFIKLCLGANIPIDMPLARRNNIISKSMQDISGGAGAGLKMKLLAPTKELVNEKKDKLAAPEGVMAFKALANTVTVPNKVSYVFSVEIGKSVILLTGDSGFTDFYNWRLKKFDANRLAELSRAQLVKVPHHGGHFEYWGKCVRELLDQERPVGDIFATSLGSAHKNPSEEFEMTVGLIRMKFPKAEFHFTNLPAKGRFDDICAQHSTQVPKMITYSTYGNGKWALDSEAIVCKKYRV